MILLLLFYDRYFYKYIWVRSRNCGCVVTWFCYQLIAKPSNKTATVSWPDPYLFSMLCIEDPGNFKLGQYWMLFYACWWPGGRFKNTYELLNLRALKISKLHKNHIFQCMGKIFCVEFQRVPLKFHTKYLTHTLKDVEFIHIWNFKSS